MLRIEFMCRVDHTDDDPLDFIPLTTVSEMKCGWCLRGASEHHEWTKTSPTAASDLAELLRAELRCMYPVADDAVKGCDHHDHQTE
jgi:hypothetical protein